MAYVRRRAWNPMCLLILLVLGTPLCHGLEPGLGICSGRFAVEDSTVKLTVQQFVNSTDSLVECRFIFDAPHDSGFLIFANDIRAVNDYEIPGCPVTVYSKEDASGDPVVSLCGHYATMTIPVPSSVALVVYKPDFNGVPYTLTMDLQVTLTGGSNLRTCGDSQINAVSTVPIKYSIGFRADAGSGDASDFCDLSSTPFRRDSSPLASLEPSPVVSPPEDVVTNDANVNATSEGPLVSIDLTTNETETPTLNVTYYNVTTGINAANENTTGGDDDDDDDMIHVIIIDYTPTTIWGRTRHWFSDTWTTMYYTVTFTYMSFESWVRSWF
ncbi:hypothetical protein MRX96_024907 [Rhipicephalus microplus]